VGVVARIRTIKPSFFKSRTIASLPLRARLTFQGLWCMADDEGRLVYDPRLVKADVWPLDDDVTAEDINADIDALTESAVIVRYTLGEGSKQREYLAISGWKEHQKINRPSVSVIPAPDGTVSAGQTPFTEEAVSAPETLAVGKKRNKERKGVKATPRTRGQQLPADYKLSEAQMHWTRVGHPSVKIQHEFEQFTDYHRAKGTVMKDWDAAWRTWVRNAVKFAAGGSTGPSLWDR
jgi:hypothetical protein